MILFFLHFTFLADDRILLTSSNIHHNSSESISSLFYIYCQNILWRYSCLKFDRTSEDQLWEEDPTLVDFKIISFDFKEGAINNVHGKFLQIPILTILSHVCNKIPQAPPPTPP